MIQQLAKPAVFRVGSGLHAQNKTLGGPGRVTTVLLDECLKRFVNWYCLAVEVLRAEFPNFDVFTAFECFNLAMTLKEHEKTLKDNLKLIAKVARIDFHRLWDQFEGCRLCRRPQRRQWSFVVLCLSAILGIASAVSLVGRGLSRVSGFFVVLHISLRDWSSNALRWFCVLRATVST